MNSTGRIYLIPAAVFAVSIIGLLKGAYPNQSLFDFYSKNMRVALFTGFFTIGGFLLSLKTFILIKLKEEFFASDTYQERYEDACALNPKMSVSLYGPLKRLGNFLFHCVLLSLLTSVAQFSIGFINSKITAAICISMSAATVSLVFIAWWDIRANLNEWFDLLEEDNRKKKKNTEQG